MPWNFRNCTSSSENRSRLGSASVRAMAPASVGVAPLMISLCVTFGGASVAIISYPLKMLTLTIASGFCQSIHQEFRQAKVETAPLRDIGKPLSIPIRQHKHEPTKLERISSFQPTCAQTLVSSSLRAGADRGRARNCDRRFLARARQIAEAARRRLHQAGQDDDRTDHLLHRRAWGRVHERYAKARAGRDEDAGLFRSRLDARAAPRSGRSERVQTRRRLQH